MPIKFVAPLVLKKKYFPFFHRSRRNLVVRKITLKSHDNHKSCEILYSQNFLTVFQLQLVIFLVNISFTLLENKSLALLI